MVSSVLHILRMIGLPVSSECVFIFFKTHLLTSLAILFFYCFIYSFCKSIYSDWPHPCDDYDFANYSKDGLGCDRTSQGNGSKMTQTYSPGVMALLDNPRTCPPNLLLFFHNKKW